MNIDIDLKYSSEVPNICASSCMAYIEGNIAVDEVELYISCLQGAGQSQTYSLLRGSKNPSEKTPTHTHT